MRLDFGAALRAYATLMLCFAPLSAGAMTVSYDMVFEDRGGNVIGRGAFTYDDALREELYIDDRDRQCAPGDLFCDYFATWTPVTSVTAEIQGQDIFAYGSDTQLWMEGYYFYQGRYEIGGYVPGSWFIGDISFGLSQFLTSPPPIGASTHTTSYFFTSVDLPDFSVSGQLTYVQAAIPLPVPALLLAFSVFCLFPLTRLCKDIA